MSPSRLLSITHLILLSGIGLGASGCGRETGSPRSDATGITPVEAPLTRSESPKAEPGLISPAAVAQVPTENPRAQQLFETLLSPGLTPEAWEQAQMELVGMQSESILCLTRNILHGNDIEREMAATLLAFCGPVAVEQGSAALLQALQDPLEFVRGNAAATLVQTPRHAAEGTATLLELLDSANPELRKMAAMNLSSIGAGAASHVDRLTQVLQREQAEDVIVPVIELLGQLGSAAEPAVPALRQIKFEQNGPASAAAESALGQIQPGL